jgi:hypothetical protein
MAPWLPTPAGIWRNSESAIDRCTATTSALLRLEFVQFAPISNIAVSVASGRVGAGFKF